MAQDSNEKWVSTKEVSEYLSTNISTIRLWIANKNFPAVKLGRSYRFKLSEVDEWMKSQGGTYNDDRK